MHDIEPVKALASHASVSAPRPIAGARASLDEVWRCLQASLRARTQPEQFETWFRRATLVAVDAEVLRIAVQNAFSRDWLQSYYRDKLEAAVREVMEGPRRIEISVDPERFIRGAAPGSDANAGAEPAASRATASEPPASRSTTSEPGGGRSTTSEPGGGRSTTSEPGGSHSTTSGPAAATPPAAPLTRDAPAREPHASFARATAVARTPQSSNRLLWNSDVGLNPKYTFDNFVVGPCNRFAHAAAVGAAEAPGKSYNPFFLHGNVGLGKTHLLQSFCFALLERNPQTRILYLSCETFVNHFISALENGDLQKFRNKYRGVDVLVVDDIHVLANKDRTQEEFFHTFNTLYQSGKQIVLSSDSPPKDIPTLQERLVSRFRWGLVTEIEPPCYETRMAILKRKSREKGREIPDDVARLLAETIDSNIRELEGAVTKLIGFAGLTHQAVTCELAREALRELFEQRKGMPSMEDILNLVTAHFDVKLSELQSKKRTNAIAYPRQIAMYLARQITRHSLEEIGGFFGGRDHSTVIYAVEKVGQLMAEDAEARAIIEGFLVRLQGPST
jgi:chromosomal replication initiator protein